MMFSQNLVYLKQILILEKPIKLYDKVINQIREDIAQGKYKSGEKIPAEPELMELYNVGRSTIREAVKTLAMTGVLKVKQGSGTFINDNLNELSIEQRLSHAHFDEVKGVRAILEKEIVNLATLNHTQEQIAEIEKQLENRKAAIQAENLQECIDADIAFHVAISHASSNAVLADLYYSFTQILRNFFSTRDTKGISHFAMNHHLHEQLFKGIKSKKTKLSQQALQQILEN